jgi:hypothetical protein
MFVTTGVGCTCSPRKKTITLSPKGTRPHGATAVAAQPVANGIPRPDRPGLPFRSNPSKMNTYAKYAAKPRTMCTSKIVGLKASCNEHLRKNGGRGRSYCYPAATRATRSRQQAWLPRNFAFPVTSALLVRSFAQERKSTPLLSCACARFCRYGGPVPRWEKI